MEPRAPDLALPGSVLTDPAFAMASGAYLFFLMPRPEEEAPAFLFIPGLFPAVFMAAGFRNVLSAAGDRFLLFRTDDLYSLLSPFPSAVCPLLFGAVSASAYIGLYAAEDANDSGFAKKRFSALAAIPLRMYVSAAVNQITRTEASET